MTNSWLSSLGDSRNSGYLKEVLIIRRSYYLGVDIKVPIVVNPHFWKRLLKVFCSEECQQSADSHGANVGAIHH